MVQFNFAERTIKAKVVYYGPAQSGKTTNLEHIHRLTDPAGNNRLISLNTAQDRTLFFDLLPFSLGAISGYDFKVQLYTVPGQVQYNATRRVVLAGADAVVFVADSRKALVKENTAAFENMKVNLLANRLVPEKLPLVLQFNKQDLPDLLSAAELGKALNPWNRRAFPAVASQGDGVMETFVAVVQEMLAAIAVKYNLKEKGLDPAAVPETVAEAFAAVLRRAGEAPPASAADDGPTPTARIVVAASAEAPPAAPTGGASEGGFVSEELLHRSIRSNVELAEALAGVVREMNLGIGAILSQVDRLSADRGEAGAHKAAVDSLRSEAHRLRRLIQGLATAEAAPAAASPAAAAPGGSGPTHIPGDLDALIRSTVALHRAPLDARGVSVQSRIPPGTALPRGGADQLQRTLGGLISALGHIVPARSQMALRCERKPVLLRGAQGEVKRDFLMLALAHDGALGPDDQQRIAAGSDPGPFGEAVRLVRDLGGFVRFAPLPGGGLETRVFLPAS
jgi:signal recognition particle receptor subunit beta